MNVMFKKNIKAKKLKGEVPCIYYEIISFNFINIHHNKTDNYLFNKIKTFK